MRLSTARLFVRDLARALCFYRDVLGLACTAGGAGMGFAVFAADGLQLVVEPVATDAPADDQALVGRFSGLSFEVDDIAAEHARLGERGVAFDSAPERQFWGGILATFRDPDGNALQLVQVPRPQAQPSAPAEPATSPIPSLRAVEIKAFVPAQDFDRSLAFYCALGFENPWSDGELAYLHHGDCSFLLQKFDAPQFAGNFMMHLLVEDADAWHAAVGRSGVVERFGARLGEPQDQPWAMRDFVLWDPSGVLWRIGHNLPKGPAGR